MNFEDIWDHELYYVQRWVRANIEGSETCVFRYSEDKEEGGGVCVCDWIQYT